MKLIVVVSDKDGIAFNNRRQSRDRVLCDNILELTKSSPLYMDEYSKTIFNDSNAIFTSSYLDMAGEDDYCFYEKGELKNIDKINEIIRYRWNQDYPQDEYFHMPEGFEIKDTWEFAGYSHELITGERWVRK